MLNSRAPKPAAVPADAKAARTTAPSLVSKDVEVTGTFVAEGDVQFDGRLDGDLRAAGVVIGEGAVVRGEVVADRVRVCGTVEGAIRADRVELTATAVVKGDVLHAALAVETGARLDGKVCCTQNPTAAKRDPLPTAKIKAELAERAATRGTPAKKAA